MDSYMNSYDSYCTGSTAHSKYDFSMFMTPERPYRSAAVTAPRTKKRTVTKSRTAKVVSAAAKSFTIANRAVIIRYALLAAVVAVTLAMLVIGQAEKHEVNSQIIEAKAMLVSLQQDHEAMSAQYDTLINDNALDQYATTMLGMQKRENSQTEYIALGGGDVFEVAGDASNSDFVSGVEKMLSYMD